MSTRTTRRSVAKEATFLASTGKENVSKQLSSSPTTPMRAKTTTSARAISKNRASPKAKKLPVAVIPGTSAIAGKKRKRAAGVKVEADPEELPHGLGKIIRTSNTKTEDLKNDIDSFAENPAEDQVLVTKKDVKQEVDKVIDASAATEGSPLKKARKSKKANTYGVTLGETPYPDHIHPTPEECQEVNDILSKVHGAVRMPEAIPLPSLTVAGCGEVPSVLEALMRTLLSAHTTNGNAATAIQGLIKRFGVLKDGIGKGSLDWNAVRLAKREDIFEAIKRGGLAKTKSAHIEKIVAMVYEENQARRAALAEKAKNPDSQPSTIVESDTDTAVSKAAETMLADPNVLTLDYVHAMPANMAFAQFLTYPGIGVKTASCTLLFCMQRPSFAVDTHVFRLCKWLGWVPEKATRDTTFAHCDVRIPDELKYSLHQLLIKHGKSCGRCRAITGESSQGWEKGCVIDHLVKRTGARKGGIIEAKVKAKAKKARISKEKKGKKAGRGDDGSEEDDEATEMEDETVEHPDDVIKEALREIKPAKRKAASKPKISPEPKSPSTKKKPTPKRQQPAKKPIHMDVDEETSDELSELSDTGSEFEDADID